MRLPGFEGEAQRLARAEQVLLADNLVWRLRAQLLGERGVPRPVAVNRQIRCILRKQIAQPGTPFG